MTTVSEETTVQDQEPVSGQQMSDDLEHGADFRVGPFRRLLVLNRGEIARRITRSAKAAGLTVVGVFSDADADAWYVHDCDVAVRLPGTASADTYLDVEALIEAARRTGVQAVHPGYGFLSENAQAAQAFIDAGLIWVGPPPAAMRLMAGKAEAKALVASLGVPVLPSRAVSTEPRELAAAGDAIGYPLLVKASAGGGGKGMRVVTSAEALADAVTSAQREAAAAFGEGTVFLERYVAKARHVEIQVLADAYGRVVHCYERECSLQRRHQKVLEESPSPGAHPSVLERMYEAAIAAAAGVGYVGAGTVEFLLDGRGPEAEFFFLEMNTRLQVEHPVTEAITGVDLVTEQLAIASGRALELPEPLPRCGHAVEVRLVAEDPAAGWVPSAGTLEEVSYDEVPGVRWDTGVRTGSVVSPFYDSLLAKVIAYGEDRTQALDRLQAALRSLRVLGVATNRDALIAIIDDADVRAGATTTDLLESRPDLVNPEPASAEQRALAAGLATAALLLDARRADQLTAFAPSDWRAFGGWVQETLLLDGDGSVRVELHGSRRDATAAEAGLRARLVAWVDLPSEPPGPPVEPPSLTADLLVLPDGRGTDVVVEVDGVRRRAAVRLGSTPRDVQDTHIDVTIDGRTTRLTEAARLPAGDRAEAARGPSSPVPGTVLSVNATVGSVVEEGTVLVVLEAMKMEHKITAAARSTVLDVSVVPGQAVDAHEVLVVLEPRAEESEADDGHA